MKYAVVQHENAHTRVKNSNVRGGPISTSTIDVRGLEHDLRAHINGEVRFDDGSHALAATDGSQYRQVPTVAIAGAGLALTGGVFAWIVKLAHLAQREDRG